MPNSLIPLRLQFFAIIISGVLLIGVVSLIRKGKLKEGYSILWFVIGFGFLLIALWTDLLKLISSLVGVDYEPATLFAILLIGTIVILIHITVLVSGFDKKDKTLAQYVGLLMWEVKQLKEENRMIKEKLRQNRVEVPTKQNQQ
ncbi:MAG: DUF2304 domain-containing protein [bacterium]|nr:DUF2304 domain-containing protein [bacterium]